MPGLRIFVLGLRGFPDVQGGVEKHCEELYPRLVKRGCDVTVVARTPYIPEEKQVLEWKGVKFIYLWCPGKKEFEALFHTFLGVLLARMRSPDILHIHAIGPSLVTPLAKIMGLKVMITHHGPDYQRQKWGICAKHVLKIGEFLGTKCADKVIVISRGIKDLLEKNYGRKDLRLILNGVDLHGVDLPEKLTTTEIIKKYGLCSRKYVFIATRFVPEKGLHDLIAAYTKIAYPEFKLVISGDADHETLYSRKIKTWAKNYQGIILTGFVSGKRLQELYANAGLFVLPSSYEGLPIALLEAMSYELPVLVSDIPATREVPLPEFRYFPVGNVDILAKKMVELFETGISEEEKQKQREMLLQDYDWDKLAQKTLEVYEEMVAERQ